MNDGTFFIAPKAENFFTIQGIARIKEILRIQAEQPEIFRKNQADLDAQLNILSGVFVIQVNQLVGYRGTGSKNGAASAEGTPAQPAGAEFNWDHL